MKKWSAALSVVMVVALCSPGVVRAQINDGQQDNDAACPTGQPQAFSVWALPATSPSGEAMPVGDLPGWRQTYADDFNTDVGGGSFPTATSCKWDAYPSPWKDTTKMGTYSPDKVVSIADGLLDQHIRTVNGTPLVSALMPRIPGQSARGQTYGRYAVRFRADKLAGYKMAWMLWPDSDDNRRDGEIDFPEKDLDTPNVYGFVHYPNAAGKNDQGWAKQPIDLTKWHTAVIAWSPGQVVFSIDGAEVGRTVNSRVPASPMHWILQTEVSLTAGRPSPNVDGHIQIDWVAMWAYAPA